MTRSTVRPLPSPFLRTYSLPRPAPKGKSGAGAGCVSVVPACALWPSGALYAKGDGGDDALEPEGWAHPYEDRAYLYEICAHLCESCVHLGYIEQMRSRIAGCGTSFAC